MIANKTRMNDGLNLDLKEMLTENTFKRNLGVGGIPIIIIIDLREEYSIHFEKFIFLFFILDFKNENRIIE